MKKNDGKRRKKERSGAVDGEIEEKKVIDELCCCHCCFSRDGGERKRGFVECHARSGVVVIALEEGSRRCRRGEEVGDSFLMREVREEGNRLGLRLRSLDLLKG